MQTTFWKELDRFNMPIQPSWRPLLLQVDDIFNDLLGQGRTANGALNYDVQETDSHYVLSCDLPGVDRNDLSIEIQGTALTVAGERKARLDGPSVAGRPAGRCGRFQHTFTLPEGVSAESVDANYKDGVLTLLVQKPAAARPTKIKIGDDTGSKTGFFKNLMKIKHSDNEPDDVRHEPVAIAN